MAVAYISPQLYKHLSQVFSSIIVFIIGHYFGEYVYNRKPLPLVFILFCTLFMPIKAFIPTLKEIPLLAHLSYALFGISLSVICSWVLNAIHCKNISNVLSFLGEMSLELYLTNIFLIQAWHYFQLNSTIDPYGLLDYIAIAFIGIGLSMVVKRYTINRFTS